MLEAFSGGGDLKQDIIMIITADLWSRKTPDLIFKTAPRHKWLVAKRRRDLPACVVQPLPFPVTSQTKQNKKNTQRGAWTSFSQKANTHTHARYAFALWKRTRKTAVNMKTDECFRHWSFWWLTLPLIIQNPDSKHEFFSCFTNPS